MKRHQRILIDELLPSIEIFLPGDTKTIDPAKIFAATVNQTWLEIGFGSGEHLVEQALNNPSIGFIGCEPYINGVARILTSIAKFGLKNVRIFRDDARVLLSALPDQSLARAFILFPDPWPKARHHKRRIVGPKTISALRRLMPAGAELRIATDDPNYKEWILRHIQSCAGFEWRARRPKDWQVRLGDWPATRYEMKADAAGRQCSFFLFSRAP